MLYPISNTFFGYSLLLYFNKNRYLISTQKLYADFKFYYNVSSYNYVRWIRKWYITNTASMGIYFFFKTIIGLKNYTKVDNLFFIENAVICSKCKISDNVTISKGPMARKKLSREQYAIKTHKTFMCIFIKFNFVIGPLFINRKNMLVFNVLNFFIKKKYFKLISILHIYFVFNRVLLLFFQLETPLGSINNVRLDWLFTDSYFFFTN
jgi:hypothetical protein